jgi:hypothetical protein
MGKPREPAPPPAKRIPGSAPPDPRDGTRENDGGDDAESAELLTPDHVHLDDAAALEDFILGPDGIPQLVTKDELFETTRVAPPSAQLRAQSRKPPDAPSGAPIARKPDTK